MANEEVNVNSTTEEGVTTVSARKSLVIFWFRMLGWLATTVVAPITTFAIKFNLFQEYGYQINTDELGNVTDVRIALSGWGIISVCLIVWAMSYILGEVISSYTEEYSFTKQILLGLKSKIIPLAVAIGVCYFLKGCFDQIIFCLWVIGLGQLAGIFLNPLPEWKAKKTGKEDYSDLISTALKALKNYNLSRKGGNQ